MHLLCVGIHKSAQLYKYLWNRITIISETKLKNYKSLNVTDVPFRNCDNVWNTSPFECSITDSE